jgi:hypothetical protein
MSEISHQDIKQTPGVLMFLTFLNVLFKNKKATVNKKNNKVFELNSEASNYFLCGRDETLKPFIGIQEDMLPWFPEMPWSKIALCYKKGMVYMIAEDADTHTTLFAMGLKIRRKRMIALADPKDVDNENLNLNLKVFKVLEGREVAISHKNLKNGIEVVKVEEISDIIDKDIDESPFSFEEDGFVSDFQKLKME